MPEIIMEVFVFQTCIFRLVFGGEEGEGCNFSVIKLIIDGNVGYGCFSVQV